MQFFKIKCARLIRTPSSESFVVFDGERLGFLDIHYGEKIASATLILERDASGSDLEEIISDIYSLREHHHEDFTISVFRGSEVAFYSDIVDHAEAPPTKKDIESLRGLIASHAGRHSRAMGHLTEHIVRHYFENMGYRVTLADAELDALKIDLKAEKSSRTIFIQVKSGTISRKEINDTIKSMKMHAPDARDSSYAFAAARFPKQASMLKIELEDKYSCRVIFITHTEISEAVPQYKSILG